jgi:hypothetical protein
VLRPWLSVAESHAGREGRGRRHRTRDVEQRSTSREGESTSWHHVIVSLHVSAASAFCRCSPHPSPQWSVPHTGERSVHGGADAAPAGAAVGGACAHGVVPRRGVGQNGGGAGGLLAHQEVRVVCVWEGGVRDRQRVGVCEQRLERLQETVKARAVKRVCVCGAACLQRLRVTHLGPLRAHCESELSLGEGHEARTACCTYVPRASPGGAKETRLATSF